MFHMLLCDSAARGHGGNGGGSGGGGCGGGGSAAAQVAGSPALRVGELVRWALGRVERVGRRSSRYRK